MTADELAAMIAEEIDNNSGTRAILAKVQRGTATLADSERFTGITAEITGRLLADNVLSLPLSDRQGAFLDITAARYRDTFSVFSAVQRALDERLGINLAVVDPGFEKARAQKAGHALADQTVPESTVVRRAESAGENIVRSQHDRIVQKQAEFRDRAGLQCSAIREGSAKCCEWCASVSGKYPASDTPQGFWGRHDNCKCSILYETRKGVQRLGGSAKKWEPFRDAGAPEPTRLTAAEAARIQAEKGLTILSEDDIIKLKEAHEYLSTIFGKVDKSISKLDRRLVIENVEQLKKLNDRFGVLNDQNTGSIFSRRSSSIAETYTNLADAQTGLMLSRKYYATYDTLIATEKAGRKSFLYMPSSDEFLSVVSITHEYGHMLENAIIRSRLSDNALSMYRDALTQGQQANARNYLKYEESIIASDIRDEIIRIAKESDPNFSLTDNLSRYGRENNFEFFAEVFANSQCGAPNALGKAMNVWFERSGL